MLPMPTAAELLPLLPEFVLAAGAFALLMLDLFLDDARRVVTWAAAIALLLVVAWMSFAGTGGQGIVMSGMFIRDTMSDVLNAGACVLVALALVYAWPYLRERGLLKGEVAVMMLFATLGMASAPARSCPTSARTKWPSSASKAWTKRAPPR